MKSSALYDLISLSTYTADRLNINLAVKGQLISKCPFGFIVSTKIPTEKFDKFCPRMGRAEFVKFFRWYFGRNDETKRTF